MTIWQKRIKALTAKGISQAKIAKETNCSPATISLLAKGERKDPCYTIGNRIVDLCDLIGVSTAEIKRAGG